MSNISSEEAIKLLEEKKEALEAELEAHKSTWTKVANIPSNSHHLRKRPRELFDNELYRLENEISRAKQKIEELKGKSPVGGKRNRKTRRKTRRNRRNKKRNTRKFK